MTADLDVTFLSYAEKFQ